MPILVGVGQISPPPVVYACIETNPGVTAGRKLQNLEVGGRKNINP